MGQEWGVFTTLIFIAFYCFYILYPCFQKQKTLTRIPQTIMAMEFQVFHQISQLCSSHGWMHIKPTGSEGAHPSGVCLQPVAGAEKMGVNVASLACLIALAHWPACSCRATWRLGTYPTSNLYWPNVPRFSVELPGGCHRLGPLHRLPGHSYTESTRGFPMKVHTSGVSPSLSAPRKHPH